MAAERISMRKTKDILRLRLGLQRSIRETARTCAVGMGTVYDVLERAHRAEVVSWAAVEALDAAALEARLYPAKPAVRQRSVPEFSRVHTELKRRGVTLELLWHEYRAEHGEAGYGYSRYCELYHQWRGSLDMVMRQVHRAGEKLFVDFAGMTMPVTNRETGEITEHPIFVAALGASSFTYAEALPGQDQCSWASAHVNAFTFIGGVPAVTVPDNLKAAVIKPDLYEPELNPSYRELAEHYGTTILPARVRRPRDKAKVENAVQQVERWVLAPLRDQKFFSLFELNDAMRERLDWLNDRPLSRLDGTRRSLWRDLDRPALRALPQTAFSVPEWKANVGVNIDYHVEFDQRFYSVPHSLCGKRVDVRAACGIVEIFFRGRRVASHPRIVARGYYSTQPEHMPDSHRRHAEWTPSRLVRWGESIGPETAAVVEEILRRFQHPEHGFRSCLGILSLAKRHGNQRLELACARARKIVSPSYRSVASILKTGLESHPLPNDEPVAVPALEHENVRGPDYYTQQEECV